MLFNSFTFACLVLATLALYYLPALRRLQKWTLIISSFVFYGAESSQLLLLLWGSIGINIASSHLVHTGRKRLCSTYAALGVIANLGLLAFFKYGPLAGRTFFDPADSIGAFLVQIPLPIGISFFTFQGITLLVDTLRIDRGTSGHVLPHESLRTHASNTTLYIAFFPQLVAGPIVKAHDFFPQIKPKSLSQIDWSGCFRKIVGGYFLKMVVADNLRDQTFWIAPPFFEARASGDLLVMLFGYSMQIFADFAGYSLIAIGIAGLFGYVLPDNFNFPYISRSIGEFWRRWHISLSSFLKEYLYVPLGGNRRGNIRTYLNLMTVMLLGGLWHGAAWSYMVWGGFHGGALAVERYASRIVRFPDNAVVNLIRMAVVFLFCTLAWLLFKLPNFSDVIDYVKATFTNTAIGVDRMMAVLILVYSLPVIVYHWSCLLAERGSKLDAWRERLSPLTYGAMLFLLLTNSGSPEAFVYFQF